MDIEKVFNDTSTNDGFFDLLNKHMILDNVIRDEKNKIFISDWYCYHPFIDEYTNNIKIEKQQKQDYIFYSDDIKLIDLISKMHEKFDNKFYDKFEILPGDGSTPFIATFCLWLLKNNVKEVYYVPPMYYTFYYFFELFKIRARPISAYQIYEDNVQLNFPNKKTYLILCDPIWYVGKSINREFIDKISKWQKETKSYIFVDGSFQYTKWDEKHFEYTSTLDKNYTFRLICPTKFLALHGYRFSYLLLPKKYYEEFLYLYANNIGSTNAYNIAFAKNAISIMLSKEYNTKITNYIKVIYEELVEKKIIYTEIEPHCGYFIFAKINRNSSKLLSMTQEFFEQKNFPQYSRINLLGGKSLESII